MIGLRKLSPGGYEYLTGSVACADRSVAASKILAERSVAHGYPAGEWFGAGADALGVSGEVTRAQMQALFGEGRHPNADQIEAELIAAGASPKEAVAATQLGRRFPQYPGADTLRAAVIAAYKQHNADHGHAPGARIDAPTRERIRRTVQASAYAETHHGAVPTDAELGAWLAEQRDKQKTACAGFEWVIAPPKSVSLAFALGDDYLRELARALHRHAVTDTLTYFEQEGAFTRRGAGGAAQFDTLGITAAMFEHWDSRAGDPHLHTHVTISTKVQGSDGKWRALDGRTVFAAAVTVSEYYNSRIRDHFRAHGATWVQRPAGGIDVKRPVWELDGIPDELIRGFSTRAAQVERERARLIVEFRQTHGREPEPPEVLEISRRAQYGTRDPKPPPASLDEHRARWSEQADGMLDDATVVPNLRGRIFNGLPEPESQPDIALLAEITRGVVSEYHAHFNTWNLLAEAHRQTAHLALPVDARDQLIGEIVSAIAAAPETIELAVPPTVEEPVSLRRRTGESVFTQHHATRYTTEQTLREEADLAAWGRLRGGHRLSTGAARRAVRRSTLNAGQREAVTAFATSGRRIELLYAPAGSGKTTAMRVFADAWRADGGRVYAFGPSARAAQELGKSIGATPHTLHQVTAALEAGVAGQAFRFARKDVLIIDEAAMAGTHTLHAVVRYALRRGADIRMIGDDRQLAAVEAGGAVRWFATQNQVRHLSEVMRFADPDQAAASLLLRDANPAGLNYYFEQGWVHGGSREVIRAAAHTAWRADLDAGIQSLLIVPTNEDVVALNLQARELRLSRGQVDPGRSVPLHDGTEASAGDWIVTRNNDRLHTLFGGRDFVKNGDVWSVLGVGADGSLRVRHVESGGAVLLSAGYVRSEVELAYATTSNRSQGMNSRGTARALVIQGISREQLYEMATRARHANHLYPETVQHTIDSHQETPPPPTARGVLEAALRRTSAETSATEELLAVVADARSLRPLVTAYNVVATLDTEDRIDTVLADLVPDMLTCPAALALQTTLLTAAQLGWDTEHLVTTALAQRPLDDADDPAAVLQWRIEQITLHEQPPPRTSTPTPPTAEHIAHWRRIIHAADPRAALDRPQWTVVWQHAAAAAADGLDVDTALADAAGRLAARPVQDPVADADFTNTALAAALAQQRATGAGQPVLPWLAHLNHPDLIGHPDLVDYHQRLSQAMRARRDQLRADVTADPPVWTARLGSRPHESSAAQDHWDELATLAAAFRDSYHVTTHDARTPLGDPPTTNSLRARAWHDLMGRWRPYQPGDPVGTVASPRPISHRATTDHPRARPAPADPDAVFAALDDADHGRYTWASEPLATLLDRYQRGTAAAVDDYLTGEIDRVLTARAPAALDTPAHEALARMLRHAYDHGWRIDQIVPEAHDLRGLDRARDPAAVLYRRVEQRLSHHPHPEQPTDTGTAMAAPVPWLDAPDPAALAADPALAARLTRLATAIDDRLVDLAVTVAVEQPPWAAALGPRPTDSAGARAWDDLAGQAAAYREIYRVTTSTSDAPLGSKPHRDGPRAHAWQHLTDHWRPPVTTPDDDYDDERDRLDDVLDQQADDEYYDDLDQRDRDEEERASSGEGFGLS